MLLSFPIGFSHKVLEVWADRDGLGMTPLTRMAKRRFFPYFSLNLLEIPQKNNPTLFPFCPKEKARSILWGKPWA
jgi:hypothetical protein